MPEQKPRTSLPFILHQADLMAARIEFEQEWLPKFKGESTQPKKETNTKQKRVNFTLEEAGKNSNLLDLVKNI